MALTGLLLEQPALITAAATRGRESVVLISSSREVVSSGHLEWVTWRDDLYDEFFTSTKSELSANDFWRAPAGYEDTVVPAGTVVQQQSAFMNLEQNGLEDLRSHRGRPMDLQWQGDGNRIFLEGVTSDNEPLIPTPKRVNLPSSRPPRGYVPEGASRQRIRALKATAYSKPYP